MITAKELRERDTTQVEHELADRYKHLFELRSQAVTEKLEDPSQLRKTRKEIARIQTVISERRNAERDKKLAAEQAERAAKAPKPETIEKPAKTEKTEKPAKKVKSTKTTKAKKSEKTEAKSA